MQVAAETKKENEFNSTFFLDRKNDYIIYIYIGHYFSDTYVKGIFDI